MIQFISKRIALRKKYVNIFLELFLQVYRPQIQQVSIREADLLVKVGVDAAVVPVDDIQQVLEVDRLYSLQIAEGRQEAVISSGGLFLGQKLADEVLDYFISEEVVFFNGFHRYAQGRQNQDCPETGPVFPGRAVEKHALAVFLISQENFKQVLVGLVGVLPGCHVLVGPQHPLVAPAWILAFSRHVGNAHGGVGQVLIENRVGEVLNARDLPVWLLVSFETGPEVDIVLEPVAAQVFLVFLEQVGQVPAPDQLVHFDLFAGNGLVAAQFTEVPAAFNVQQLLF